MLEKDWIKNAGRPYIAFEVVARHILFAFARCHRCGKFECIRTKRQTNSHLCSHNASKFVRNKSTKATFSWATKMSVNALLLCWTRSPIIWILEKWH